MKDKSNTALLEKAEAAVLDMLANPGTASPARQNVVKLTLQLVAVKDKVNSGFGGMFEKEEEPEQEEDLGAPILGNGEFDNVFEDDEDDGRQGTDAGGKADNDVVSEGVGGSDFDSAGTDV